MRITRKGYRSVCLLLSLFFIGPLLCANAEDNAPPIVQHMRKIDENLRRLRGQYDQTDLKSENVQVVEAMRTHVKSAQKLQPLKTPQISADQREAFLKAFRSELDKVLDTLDQLETALRQDDTESAQALILKLYDLKEQGHQKFQSEGT